MFENITFKGNWRPYQERVLNELDEHLLDGKLHVVAAPGSGKTLLGLEVLRRLNKNALILAPTITIREQWIDRFKQFFLNDVNSDIITGDLKHPKTITVSTYQALHSAFHKVENEEESNEEKVLEDYKNFDLMNSLISSQIETIVLDEAHHLRTEWWKSLTDVIEQLGNVTIISLTATPPYDVSMNEWLKYKELCGPIDAEIYVPELVSDHNLCPHQDYVYFNYPTEDEIKEIDAFKDNVSTFISELSGNQLFIEAIQQHPYIRNASKHIESILKDPAYFTSLLVFLHHVEMKIPKEVVSILGHVDEIPPLTLEWMEILLKGCLYTDIDRFTNYQETMDEVKRLLNQIGCIDHKTISLKNNAKIDKILMNSLGKLNSIHEIVKAEYVALGDDLKLVILTDFIRKEVLPKNEEDVKPIHQLGVIPIFESLRRLSIPNLKIAVLSGSLVIIPNNCKEAIDEIRLSYGISSHQLKLTPLPIDSHYYIFELVGQSNKLKVNIVSELFSKGLIHILIGTKSLLGEGWDEPTINTLIMASFVGSYMLSNQMRGRAIRMDQNNPLKSSNIWHLVCVDYEKKKMNVSEMLENKILGIQSIQSEDYETLKRRFKGFVGVSYTESRIENGIDRLSYITPPFTKDHVSEINQKMIDLSKDREGLRQKWFDVIDNTTQAQIIEETTTEEIFSAKKFVYFDAITILFIQTIFLSIYFSLIAFNEIEKGLVFVLSILIVMNLFLLPLVFKAILLLIRYGSVRNSLKQIGRVILDTLLHLDLIKSLNPRLIVKKDNRFMASCYIENATSFEKNLFNDCLEELLGVIDNPRYLIERKGIIWHFQTKDYHAVPSVIGKNKESALYFSKRWSKLVGDNQIIYTRDLKGRKILLRARIHSLSFKQLNRLERKKVYKDKWH